MSEIDLKISEKVIIDWDGLVLAPSFYSPALVLSKVNAPFLYGDVIEQEVPYLPTPPTSVHSECEEPELPEEEYLSAIGLLHKKAQDTVFNRD